MSSGKAGSAAVPLHAIWSSLRFRITAWYTAFFSLLLVAFAVFLYQDLARSATGRLGETLRSESATAATVFGDELEEAHGNAGAAAGVALAEVRLAAGHLAIYEGGRLMASSTPLSAAEQSALPAPSARVVALPHLGRYGARAVATGLDRNGRHFLLVVTAPLDAMAADLAAVRSMLWFALPPLVALAALGGWWVATRNVAPLGWMAEQASAISGSNLDKRLEIGRAARELTVLAASFNELLARLDRSFDSMRRFVADASHEMRTPLAVIRGEADVALSRDRTPVEYQASLGLILDESRRLSRLVDALLPLARADAGRVKLRCEEFYLNELLAECCRSLYSLAAARQVELECRTYADVAFRGDQELLRRLVVNLLDNAIRYTQPGGKAEAALEIVGRDLRIVISDNGPGIAPDAAPHVFERFYRADKARDREGGGSGLGLAIVKWIAESHGGAVSFASQPGAGTTFTVSLPRP